MKTEQIKKIELKTIELKYIEYNNNIFIILPLLVDN